LFAVRLRLALLLPDRRGDEMKRRFTALIAAIVLTLALALPASAGAKFDDVLWRCDPDGSGFVTFVSAPAAAEHGITRADERAGNLAFERVGGEDCHVGPP
jgi:hypothetical protein